MEELDLTEEDWERVRAVCRHVHIGDDVPGYLQEFLARWLEHDERKQLAAKVRGFGGGQMARLWERVRRQQDTRTR